MVDVDIVFLHKVQLHVSALDNGHLQVVNEILSKEIYETYVGCIQWGGRSRGGYEIWYVMKVGWGGYMGTQLLYVMSKLI